MIKTIVSTELPVGERLLVRKNVISGGTGGKRICIVSGTHGDELEGQMVCYELVKALKEHLEYLDGEVDVYPALNPLGIDTIQRGIPNFDLDMNRIFPGSSGGSMAEQVAYSVMEDLKGADVVIDVHSSNLYLRETPQVRINVLSEQQLVPLARYLHVPFIWVHDAATVLEATLAYSLNSTGTPCLVVEMGVGQRINDRMCTALVRGIFSLMRYLDMWLDGAESDLSDDPIVCKGDRVSFLNAETSGVFLTELKCGTVVRQGQRIGAIVDPLRGSVLSQVASPVDGFLFTIRAYPIVYEGSLMARIYNFENKEANASVANIKEEHI